MKKSLFLLFFGLFLAGWMVSCHPRTSNGNNSSDTVRGDNELTKAEKAEGWQLLFDGKTLNGWRTFHESGPTQSWQAADGKIVFTPSSRQNGGDLMTADQYENFHFKVDWKISDCGNSGVIFLVQEEGFEKTYHTGPEMQVLDNTCHSDAKYPNHRAGSLYDLIQALPETVKPAGEWNTAEIILDKGHLVFRLNGTQVVETQLFDREWKEMIVNSKFKQWYDFGKFRKGHIAFQDHGDKVEFKNIKIREL